MDFSDFIRIFQLMCRKRMEINKMDTFYRGMIHAHSEKFSQNLLQHLTLQTAI